ncbi:DgyrCDS9224 [Dimorphilus gyrociliatus]|uniref:DgyrCDS9224 n=1 Tax=Dimorphilus gyrociliatus TaxID=2664684 RepID=A0A7I8VXW4_9ANNE|nr:DgyrCDS9224 [Dimorphilus gyrociliatus]
MSLYIEMDVESMNHAQFIKEQFAFGAAFDNGVLNREFPIYVLNYGNRYSVGADVQPCHERILRNIFRRLVDRYNHFNIEVIFKVPENYYKTVLDLTTWFHRFFGVKICLEDSETSVQLVGPADNIDTMISLMKEEIFKRK